MPNLSDQELALYRRAAKVERYRRDFPRCFAEQFAIRPKLGPVARYPLWPHQMMIEDVISRQLKEFGWIRLAEFKCRQEGGSTKTSAGSRPASFARLRCISSRAFCLSRATLSWMTRWRERSPTWRDWA